MLNGLILTPSDAHIARMRAIVAFSMHGTGITSFNASSADTIKQYEVVCFKNENDEFQVFVIDKKRAIAQGLQDMLFLAQACFEEKDSHLHSDSLVAVKISSDANLISDMQSEYKTLVRLCRAKGFCTISLGDLVQTYLFSQYLPSLDQTLPKARRSSDKESSGIISPRITDERHVRQRSQSAVPRLEISRMHPEKSGVLRSPASADRSPKITTPKSASSKPTTTPRFQAFTQGDAPYISSARTDESDKLSTDTNSSPRKVKIFKPDS